LKVTKGAKEMIGTRFKVGNTEYEVNRIDEMEGLETMKRKLVENDKEPRTYFAGKVLKSGKVSEKQGGMFYRFKSGRFLKVL
jgi:hypothetical protein